MDLIAILGLTDNHTIPDQETKVPAFLLKMQIEKQPFIYLLLLYLYYLLDNYSS